MSMYGSITEDVKAYLGEHVDDYDVEAIVAEIRKRGFEDIEDMGQPDFVDLLQANDVSNR